VAPGGPAVLYVAIFLAALTDIGKIGFVWKWLH
jgi:hypothetical protein